MIETSMGWGDLRVLGGEGDSHLKKLFKRVLRQKILPMCVCVRIWLLLTELVSYMYPIYVHYMYILDVLSFPFGSRH